MSVPSARELMNPTLDAIKRAGRSASIGEITELVTQNLDLPESVTSESHSGGSQSELEYRLGWARTYLKRLGLITNSSRGVWTLTSRGVETPAVVPDDVVQAVRKVGRQVRNQPESDDDLEIWKEQLIAVLLKMDPDAFERLCSRMLRESNFIEVNVTGRSGDGGVDGRGVIRMGGLISFPVVFQCNRYRGSVPPSAVRDLRGAMAGRADRGLLITTGRFTRDAKAEAARDGAAPIDLIDGNALAEKLKELQLGVKTETVEQTTIDQELFSSV